jgi:serine/threonine protein kinase
MDRPRYQVGDLIRGDHRVLAVHTSDLAFVYTCRQDLPGGNRTYKVLKTFRFADREVCRQLFERELVYWTRLPAHPNVVQAKDADTLNQLLVLEFVPGPSLLEVVADSPLYPRHFLRWARQVAEGLRFLHTDNQFLHRDVRPRNILIDASKGLVAKLSDLGIGKPFDPSVASHTAIGVLNFMAPEVFDHRTDYRSDIFSFGGTLYYALTGQNATRRSTRIPSQVAAPSELVPAIPDAVSACVLKCLERAPEDRYQKVEDLLRAVERLEEWPVEDMPFERCGRHDYFFSVRSGRTRCPFCSYDERFRAQEAKLEAAMSEHGSEDRRRR